MKTERNLVIVIILCIQILLMGLFGAYASFNLSSASDRVSMYLFNRIVN